MRLPLTPCLLTSVLVITGLAGGRIPAAAPVLTGSGAPYIQRMAGLVRRAPDVRIVSQMKFIMHQHGKAVRKTGMIDIAWAQGDRLRAWIDLGFSPPILLIGSEQKLYTVTPTEKQYTLMPAAAAHRMESLLRERAILTSEAPTHWTYQGTKRMAGRLYDVVLGAKPGERQTLYLDRLTHLPCVDYATSSTNGIATEAEVIFRKFQLNVRFAPDFFTFTPPKGYHEQPAPHR